MRNLHGVIYITYECRFAWGPVCVTGLCEGCVCVFACDCVGSDVCVCVCAVCEEDMRAGSVDLQTCTFPQASLGGSS
jgi:hypothetical protein